MDQTHDDKSPAARLCDHAAPRFSDASRSDTLRAVPAWILVIQTSDSAVNGSDNPVVNASCKLLTQTGGPSTDTSETRWICPVATSITYR